MFRIGIPELIFIFGIIAFLVFLTWATARRSAGRPKHPPLPGGGAIIDVVDSSATGRLKELIRLLDSGLINQAEYDEKKAEILRQL
jgi:hypothetical protein